MANNEPLFTLNLTALFGPPHSWPLTMSYAIADTLRDAMRHCPPLNAAFNGVQHNERATANAPRLNRSFTNRHLVQGLVDWYTRMRDLFVRYERHLERVADEEMVEMVRAGVDQGVVWKRAIAGCERDIRTLRRFVDGDYQGRTLESVLQELGPGALPAAQPAGAARAGEDAGRNVLERVRGAPDVQRGLPPHTRQRFRVPPQPRRPGGFDLDLGLMPRSEGLRRNAVSTGSRTFPLPNRRLPLTNSPVRDPMVINGIPVPPDLLRRRREREERQRQAAADTASLRLARDLQQREDEDEANAEYARRMQQTMDNNYDEFRADDEVERRIRRDFPDEEYDLDEDEYDGVYGNMGGRPAVEYWRRYGMMPPPGYQNPFGSEYGLPRRRRPQGYGFGRLF